MAGAEATPGLESRALSQVAEGREMGRPRQHVGRGHRAAGFVCGLGRGRDDCQGGREGGVPRWMAASKASSN